MSTLRDRMRESRSGSESQSADEPTGAAKCPLSEIKEFHIGIFFDGTGNNKDDSSVAETNVARLHNLYMVGMKVKAGTNIKVFREKEYVQGVGSLSEKQMKDKAGDPNDDSMFAGIKEEYRYRAIKYQNIMGGAFGTGGLVKLKNTYLKLKNKCKKYPPDAEKTVDIFGFSRGASLSRTFVNLVNQSLIPEMEKSKSMLKVRFVGIFDTVASFGEDEDKKQNLGLDSGDAQQIMHCVANLEMRHNFPLTACIQDAEYLGVHSDIGGGYGSGEDGKLNHLAYIPLADMHKNAVACGVELSSLVSPINVEQLREMARVYDPTAAAIYDPNGDFKSKQKAFMDKYIHDSAHWYKIGMRAEFDGVRRILPNIKKNLAVLPPDFEWS